MHNGGIKLKSLKLNIVHFKPKKLYIQLTIYNVQLTMKEKIPKWILNIF